MIGKHVFNLPVFNLIKLNVFNSNFKSFEIDYEGSKTEVPLAMDISTFKSIFHPNIKFIKLYYANGIKLNFDKNDMKDIGDINCPKLKTLEMRCTYYQQQDTYQRKLWNMLQLMNISNNIQTLIISDIFIHTM